MTVPVPHSHCSACGAPYPAGTTAWPRACSACATTAYRNPLPVAVALLPVTGPAGTGLLAVTRAIDPGHGGTALPGGFIDHGEDWRTAVVRELREETGLDADPEAVRLADALSSGEHLLLFGLLPPVPADALPAFTPTPETSARLVLPEPRTLVFPLHTEAAGKWFAGAYG
ncbi:DNA mismatch repair protein MutT [Streptomyces sp. NE5-10]|uniref:NUDIX domain-containing protein n=1 Tax=Streptomyces sp. NE5-10 TaxID=2759674 RepID=UPI001A627FE5|nr:NUDIX domain-containing protein [Streptomyces sp. NE5-10]GHJ96663.1 DNA mismatch repair protein MutT [Streptomyces sp. NE5-10]